jgi:hypothetical protein
MLGKLALFAALVVLFPQTQNHPSHSATQRPNSNSPQPIPADRAADSYAILSLLMPGSPADTISPRQIHHWVVADTTVSITDMNPAVPPNGQLEAPPDKARAFNDAVRDFELHRYQRFRLDADSFHPKLSLSLFNQQQVNNLRQSHPVDSGITFFSGVYFNDPQTVALVYVNNWCANLCSAGQWVYLEKHGGQWVRRSGILAGGA